MGLLVLDGVQEALEGHSLQRKRKLERALTTPVKRRSIELKKSRVQECTRRSVWTKKHGHDYTYGSGDESVSTCKEKRQRSGNLCKRSKGLARACSACGSSTHRRRTHRDCPFNSATVISSEGEELGVASDGSSMSECDFFESDLCTCGSSGRTHTRECPLSLRKRFPQQAASPVPPSRSPSPKCAPSKQTMPSPTTVATRPHMKVGDHVCVHSRFMGSSHLPCRIVEELDGRYQLYCTRGILLTSFSAAELTPLASGSVIALEN